MPDPAVLFIGGLGRSGSTILDLMLGQVPGFVAVGELAYLWRRSDKDLCGCGRPFDGCPFWTEVGTTAFGGWSAVNRSRIAGIRARVERNRRIPGMLRDERDASPERRELDDTLRRLHRAIAQVSGARVVIDSTKDPASAFHLRSMGGVDLRVVHLVRDARGVAYSWTKHKERPGIAGGAVMDRYPPWRIAGRWLSYNGAFHVLARRGVPTLRLRYEDLVADPASWLARLAAFGSGGVSPAPATFPFLRDHSVSLVEEHTIAGNPMRFERGAVELHRDDAWRTGLPDSARRLVTLIDAPLLRRYGYLE